MKTKYLLLFLMLSGISGNLCAQDINPKIYRTIRGDLAISINRCDTIHHCDSLLLMVSNNLLVTLDYQTSKIHFHVWYETFRTGIDSIDLKLKALRGMALEFTGKLGITINTKYYAPQKYNMEGTLTSIGPPATVWGTGSMTCMPMPTGGGMMPTCTLLASMETTLSVLNLSEIFTAAEDAVRIDLRQSILENEKQ